MVGTWIATAYALFLYSVEHAYEGVYLVPRSGHNRTIAAIAGSSYLLMPWWFKWASFGVEYHHVHHLNARVPGYRLKVRDIKERDMFIQLRSQFVLPFECGLRALPASALF